MEGIVMTDIHSCSYYCDRPGCIKAQRDELRERLAQPEQESFSPEAISATQAAWKMGYDAAKAEQPEQEPVAWIDEFGNVFPLGAQRGPKHLNEPMKPLYTAPPQRKPLTREKEIALREGYFADAEKTYFEARADCLNTAQNRRLFEAGFNRGWHCFDKLKEKNNG